MKTYSEEHIRLLGKKDVDVSSNHQTENLDLVIVRENGPNLLGCDWLKFLSLELA